jgi:hypothetical protein
VSTVTNDGYQSWDIAHHLKRHLGQSQPSLNQIAVMRVAMSTGWDLTCKLPGVRVEIPHPGVAALGLPGRYVARLPDGNAGCPPFSVRVEPDHHNQRMAWRPEPRRRPRARFGPYRPSPNQMSLTTINLVI